MAVQCTYMCNIFTPNKDREILGKVEGVGGGCGQKRPCFDETKGMDSMSLNIAMDAARHPQQLTSKSQKSLRPSAVAAILTIVLLMAGWYVRNQAPYSSNSEFAYYLGLVGGILMLALLLYPLRKRIHILQQLGPLRYWFRFHMIAGILGPLLVLFHSTFHVRSVNAAVALSSMLLVAASGIVGRFLYRRIHRGLYGRRTTHDDLQQVVDKKLKEVRGSLILPNEVKQEIENFARLVLFVPEARWQRMLHFLSLGIRRHVAVRNARNTMADHAKVAHTVLHGKLADLHEVLLNIDATLRAAQAAAQFSTYERLFSQWHAVHVPFLFMLLITAIVHVVAVHAY